MTGPAMVLALQASAGNQAVGRWLARATPEAEEKVDAKDYSARFEGDSDFLKIQLGTKELAKPAKGTSVTKLQQALVDMGYKLPKFGVDGSFGDETETAVKKFQSDSKIADTGKLDRDTLDKLNAIFDTKKPYLDNAKFDPADPKKGTRNLSADDKKAVLDAMVPSRGTKGKFEDVVAGKSYADEIRDGLDKVIKAFHKKLFEDKEKLRADPKKNFHDWNVIEKTAKASSDAVDAVYGSYNKKPPMTVASGNLVDQWEDELAANKKLKDPEKESKARNKVEYLIASNLTEINKAHSAVPTASEEAGKLKPVIDSFVDTPAKVQTLLELDIGWEGAQLEGTIYLQRFKKDKDDDNRKQLWELFHTCIHEYIHGLADPKYMAYAHTLDTIRYNTLVEGMCDFFTENVRKTVKVDDKLRAEVEGPYYDAKQPAPVVKPGVYPSIAQAEQVVSIVGIRNAELAYFKGKVDKIGGK